MTMSESETIQSYLQREKGLKSQSSADNKRNAVNGLQDWMEDVGVDSLTDVTPTDIESYMSYMSNQGYSPKTMHIRYTALKSVFDYLSERENLMEESPFEPLEYSDFSSIMNGTKKENTTKEEMTYVTPEQVDKIVDHLSAPKLRNELIVRLMFQTGMREIEANTTRIDDVDREERSVKIHGKGSKNRTVYYQPSLDILLSQWIDGGYRASNQAAQSSDNLFITNTSEQLSRGRISRIIKNAAKDAGINEVMYVDQNGLERWKYTAHSLRHGHAVEALKSGIDVRTVQKHMGHSSLEQTMKYLRLVEDDVRKSYQNFGASD